MYPLMYHITCVAKNSTIHITTVTLDGSSALAGECSDIGENLLFAEFSRCLTIGESLFISLQCSQPQFVLIIFSLYLDDRDYRLSNDLE